MSRDANLNNVRKLKNEEKQLTFLGTVDASRVHIYFIFFYSNLRTLRPLSHIQCKSDKHVYLT